MEAVMYSVRQGCIYSAIAILVVISAGCSKSETRTETPIQNVTVGASVSKWEGKLIRRPGNSGEDGKIYVVQGGIKRWTSPAWLELHGYKFSDVSLISPEELASIPIGEPIQ